MQAVVARAGAPGAWKGLTTTCREVKLRNLDEVRNVGACTGACAQVGLIKMRPCGKAGNWQGARSTVLGCEGDSTQRGLSRMSTWVPARKVTRAGSRARGAERLIGPRGSILLLSASIARENSRFFHMLLLRLPWRSRAVAAALTHREARAGKHRSSLTHR